jgi:plasmid maintenance system antidote protein VapI
MRKPKLTRAEDDLLELLASLVVQYEQTRFPAPDVPPAEMLAHLMEVRGVTADELGGATAIPASTIAQYVHGSRPIPNAGRAKLAGYFHVSPDLFLPVE